MLRSLLLLFIVFEVHSKEVLTSYNYLTNTLMPKGIFAFGYNASRSTLITNRYDNRGVKISNTEWNSKVLNFNDLVQSAKNDSDKVLSSSAFKAFGVDLGSNAGIVENEVDVESSAKTFILGYGISNDSNLFIIVPTIQVNFDVNSRFNASQSYNDLISDLKSSGQAQKADYLERVKSNPLKTRLNENGQKLPKSIDSIANIYLNYRKSFNKIISDTYAIIPYGYRYSTDDFIDFKLNDNSLGIRQGVGTDIEISKKSVLGLYSSYHYRFPFQMDYRVPRTESDPMSSDIEKDVRIKYGDQLDISSQYAYQWNEVIGGYLNLRYQYSFQDQYNGDKFSSKRYKILENDTDSKSFSAQFGLSINTISSFLRKKFLIPMDLNIQYSKTVYAQNSFDADWIGLNMMVFYK